MKTPSRKIMIIEDDQPLFHSLSFTLKRHEYTVDLASNVLEALDNLIVMQRSMDPYSMLLTNIQPPCFTGLELIDRPREQGIGLPKLVITAYHGNDLIAQLEERGIKELLAKPFGSDELVKRVSTPLVHGLTIYNEIQP
jgi:DNA-binding response OmpR family regulator